MLKRKCRKYIAFSVPIKKEVVNCKEEEKDDNCKKDSNCKKNKNKTTTCRIKVIDSFRFMSTSL